MDNGYGLVAHSAQVPLHSIEFAVVRSELWLTLNATISLKISFRLYACAILVPGCAFLLYIENLMFLLLATTQCICACLFVCKYLLTFPGSNSATGQIFLIPSKMYSCMLDY